jgi:hypothetical protein
MLINKARHFIGKSNYIFLPLPLNKIKKIFCPHGLNIMSMWQEYFVYMYKYFEKILLVFTKMFTVHAQIHDSCSCTHMGEITIKGAKGFVDN